MAGELAADNALLQKALLDALKKNSSSASREESLEAAARARAEAALKELLQDKEVLERALVAQISQGKKA